MIFWKRKSKVWLEPERWQRLWFSPQHLFSTSLFQYRTPQVSFIHMATQLDTYFLVSLAAGSTMLWCSDHRVESESDVNVSPTFCSPWDRLGVPVSQLQPDKNTLMYWLSSLLCTLELPKEAMWSWCLALSPTDSDVIGPRGWWRNEVEGTGVSEGSEGAEWHLEQCWATVSKN